MSTKMIERAEIKATATEVDQHVIEFYALTFRDTPDKQGDRIDRDAVDGWLDEFYKGGFPLPISFTHAAVKNPTDPFAIIGYAPADPEHVFKDERGLRVRAYLDTGSNETAQQVYMLAKRGIVNRASVAYIAEKEMADPMHKGGTVIQQMRVMEAGLCLDPADDDAELMAVKVDETQIKAWDGAAAMRSCSTAADFRSIAFELRNDSAPDTQAHWALPHHDRPGAGPNQGGVSAALGRLNQTGPTVMSKDAIRSHLEAHQPAEREASAEEEVTVPETVNVTIPLADYEELRSKAGRRLSAATAASIRAAIETLRTLLGDVELEELEQGKANGEEPETANPEEPGPNAELRVRLAAFGQ